MGLLLVVHILVSRRCSSFAEDIADFPLEKSVLFTVGGWADVAKAAKEGKHLLPLYSLNSTAELS